jgi:hypothetical protein
MKWGKKFLLCVLALSASSFGQTTWYVDDDNAGYENGSEEYPYNTIQEAVDVTEHGDTVLVRQGTYDDVTSWLLHPGANPGKCIVHFPKGIDITLTSEDPNDWEVVQNTIITNPPPPAEQAGVCVCVHGMTGDWLDPDPNTVVIKGFTLQNACAGVFSPDTFTTDNLVISNCIIQDHTAYGIACETFGSATINNNILRKNASSGSIFIVMWPPEVTITNNLMYDSMCGISLDFLIGSFGTEITIRNNTIVENNYGIYLGSSYHHPDVQVSNCIFWGNTYSDIYQTVHWGGDFSIAYSCIEDDTWSDETNIHEYPNFVDSENDNFRLTSVSPCIDIGDPNGNYENEYDLDGQNRFNYPYVDMGAYEWYGCYIVGRPRYYDEFMNPGPAITQANYDAWLACGRSDCWCCPHHGYGDVNGDGYINPNDVSTVNNAFLAGIFPPIPPQYVRCDVNHDGFINPNDVSDVNNKFLAGVPQLPNTCPDCP